MVSDFQREHEHDSQAETTQQTVVPARGADLLACERGGVFAEAVIILPVVILVWSLVAFVNGGFERALAFGTETRGQGWNDAFGGCESGVATEIDRGEQGNFFMGSLAPAAAVVTSAAELLEHQPALLTRADTFRFEFEAYRYRQDETVTRPGAIGGDARLGYHVDLPCDERHDEVNLGQWIVAATVAAR